MASGLPDYVASATPIPEENRAPWYKNTAQTYAGIMLWFVFWSAVPLGASLGDRGTDLMRSAFAGGTLAQGLGVALLALVVEMGLQQALIQTPELSDEIVSTLSLTIRFPLSSATKTHFPRIAMHWGARPPATEL